MNENLNHICTLHTLLACHCNGHGDCAYWQDWHKFHIFGCSLLDPCRGTGNWKVISTTVQ